MRILAVVLFVVLKGCIQTHPPEQPPQPPLVYRGQYVIDMQAAGEWCPWFSSEKGQKYCKGLPAGTYSINVDTGSVWLIQAENLEPEKVPYNPESDLCEQQGIPNCSPNYVIEPYEQDPMIGELWGLDNIKAREVWPQVSDGSGVIVSVTDTGVMGDHPDLSGIVTKCYNAVADREILCVDDGSHGTHVAGTIAAIRDNGIGVAGVAPVRIISAKFLGGKGGGSLYDAIKSIDWSIKNGAQIINASWGCRNCYSEPLEDAIRRAGDAGILFVAAAGNDGSDNDAITHHYPSDYKLSNIISVAAIDKNQKLAYFSNYGTESVDIAAPGVNITSTWNDGAYRSISGTSMATPHVAGAAALLVASGLTPLEAGARLIEYGRPVESLRSRIRAGKTIDVAAAISSTKLCQDKRLKDCRERCEDRYKCKCKKKADCRAKCKERWCR